MSRNYEEEWWKMSKINFKVSMIICVVCLFVVIVMGVSVYVLKQVVLMDTEKTKKNSGRFLKDNVGDIDQVLDIIERKSKKVMLRSRYGHNILVEYVMNDDNYDKTTVVLVHGHALTLESMYPIAQVLLDNDINIVLYDQRAHGLNTARTVTFGYYEKDDLEDVIDYVRSNMSKKNGIGLLGQSMGAATVGFYSGTEHASRNIDFVVMDCPYDNMESIIRTTGRRRGYNRLQLEILVELGSIANKICMKFFYKDMDVVQAVSGSDIPMLVYESRYDKTCPYYMADEVYKGIKHNKKEKIMFDNSEHIRGFYKEKDKYVRILLEFIRRYGKGGN